MGANRLSGTKKRFNMREITVYFYSIENDVGESKTITNVGEERSDGPGAMTLNGKTESYVVSKQMN